MFRLQKKKTNPKVSNADKSGSVARAPKVRSENVVPAAAGQFVRLHPPAANQNGDAAIAKKKPKSKKIKSHDDGGGISPGKAKYLEKKAKKLQAIKSAKKQPPLKSAQKMKVSKPVQVHQNGAANKKRKLETSHSESPAKKSKVDVDVAAEQTKPIVSKTAKRRAARSQGKRQQAAAAAAAAGGEVTKKKTSKGPAHLFAPGDEPKKAKVKPTKVAAAKKAPPADDTNEDELATDVLSFRDKLMGKFEKLKAGKPSTKSSPESDIELSNDEDEFSDDGEDDADVEKVIRPESSFREKLIGNLKGSRFRFLNEILYSKDGSGGVQLFKEDKAAFKAYHEGYRQQVQQWPLNPLDRIIKAIKKM